VRRWRPARRLRAGDYIHYPCSGCRVTKVVQRRIGAGVGVECELDSGTVMFASHPPGRDLDVTRSYAGWRRLLPVF
jgi:hypothetical protein